MSYDSSLSLSLWALQLNRVWITMLEGPTHWFWMSLLYMPATFMILVPVIWGKLRACLRNILVNHTRFYSNRLHSVSIRPPWDSSRNTFTENKLYCPYISSNCVKLKWYINMPFKMCFQDVCLPQFCTGMFTTGLMMMMAAAAAMTVITTVYHDFNLIFMTT